MMDPNSFVLDAGVTFTFTFLILLEWKFDEFVILRK